MFKGGGLFEFQTHPPPPPDPPKVFEPVFLRFEILGERVGAKGAENVFLPFLRGYMFFHPMSVRKEEAMTTRRICADSQTVLFDL